MKKPVILFCIISIIIICAVAMFFIVQKNNSNMDNSLEIWWYEQKNLNIYNHQMEGIVKAVESFAKYQNIDVKIVKYSYKNMSYSDYVFKRNIALSSKNAITIDDINNLYSIREYHGDYSKLVTYNSLFEKYKDKYCIPLGIFSEMVFINKDILKYYGIEANKKVYKYEEFLELRQELKDKGARFNPIAAEYNYTVDYYVKKNKLNLIDMYPSDKMNQSLYAENLKKAIIEIYDDINNKYSISYNYDYLKDIGRGQENISTNEDIIDINSGLSLMSLDKGYPLFMSSYSKYRDIENKIPVLLDGYFKYNSLPNPSIFFYNREHDNCVYKVADLFFDYRFYIRILPPGRDSLINAYLPSWKNKSIFKYLEIDESFNSISIVKTLVDYGQVHLKPLFNTMDNVAQVIMDDDYNIETIDNSFSNHENKQYLYEFIIEQIDKIMKDPNYMNKLDDKVNNYIKNCLIRIK